jgi:hypothetical protein
MNIIVGVEVTAVLNLDIKILFYVRLKASTMFNEAAASPTDTIHPRFRNGPAALNGLGNPKLNLEGGSMTVPEQPLFAAHYL